MDSVQTTLAAAIVALLVVLATISFRSRSIVTVHSSSTLRKPLFLILGECGAGKTMLLHRLLREGNEQASDSKLSTVSLISRTIAHITLPLSRPAIGLKFQLIDYPGHPKYAYLLEQMMVDEISLQKIRGIVFVIDGQTTAMGDPSYARQVATTIARLLQITERKHNGIDILFAVNKGDMFGALPAHRVREILEAEIGRVAEGELLAQEEQGQSSIDTDRREFWMSIVGTGTSKRPFKFERMEGNMDFFYGSILGEKVEPWINWLDERVVNLQDCR